jgi:hypothetical protein
MVAAGVLASGVCACATQGALLPVAAEDASRLKAPDVDLAKVAESLRGGTRADVIAALGPATVIRFDSGYEVWVYRVEASPRKNQDRPPNRGERGGQPSELVMLFNPSGSVSKIRVRSGSPGSS